MSRAQPKLNREALDKFGMGYPYCFLTLCYVGEDLKGEMISDLSITERTKAIYLSGSAKLSSGENVFVTISHGYFLEILLLVVK